MRKGLKTSRAHILSGLGCVDEVGKTSQHIFMTHCGWPDKK